jgi:tripeptidyl-peptidase-1
VFSVSYGDDEDSVTYDYASRCNVEFQKQGLRGISLLFASGDDGAGSENNSTNGGCQFDPNFPVSSPYVTAVGGTALGLLQRPPEFVNSLSGGGFSNYFARPSYQVRCLSLFSLQSSHIIFLHSISFFRMPQ